MGYSFKKIRSASRLRSLSKSADRNLLRSAEKFKRERTGGSAGRQDGKPETQGIFGSGGAVLRKDGGAGLGVGLKDETTADLSILDNTGLLIDRQQDYELKKELEIEEKADRYFSDKKLKEFFEDKSPQKLNRDLLVAKIRLKLKNKVKGHQDQISQKVETDPIYSTQKFTESE